MKLFISFATEQEVRFVVLVEPTSTVASLRQRIASDFRSVFPSRLPLCFFRMASAPGTSWMVVTTGLERLEREELGRFLHHCFTLLLFGSASEADGFFLTDGAIVGEVLDDGATVTCHRADKEVAGAPLSDHPSPEEVSGLFATFTSQVSYVAKAVCHAAASCEACGAMPILLAMLMLRGPNLQLVRSAALEVLSSLPDSSPRKLSAFLAAGGLFVLLSMLSPSTKQGHEAEVERAAQLFEELLAQHGGVLAPLLEECNPSSLLQKLAKDSRSSAKTKQHALAGRRVLERGETLGRPPRGDVRAERRHHAPDWEVFVDVWCK
eukprot:g7817.t1